VSLLVLARLVSTFYSKKNGFDRTFRMCDRVVHVLEMAYVCTLCSITTNQLNKLALAINWETSSNGMCVTIANISGKRLLPPDSVHRTLKYQKLGSVCGDHIRTNV
jgi:hypothetical protein